MSQRTDHDGCLESLRRTWKLVHASGEDLTDITISTEPPLVRNPYITGCQCPHGVTYWIEPTSEQIARWRAAGTP